MSLSQFQGTLVQLSWLPWLWFSWGRELACLPWVCYPHGMCPCLCRKVLCLPCCAEFSLPWLILHCWLQHWCRLGSWEWSPFPQQILLSHHFMKKTKILSIFSHPSTLKSMPILRAAVFRLLQSVPSHCPCLSQGLGSVKPLRSRKKHSSIHSEAGLGLVWPYSPTGKWSATKCMKEPVLELCCVSLWNKKKCQLNFTFKSRYLLILEFALVIYLQINPKPVSHSVRASM